MLKTFFTLPGWESGKFRPGFCGADPGYQRAAPRAGEERNKNASDSEPDTGRWHRRAGSGCWVGWDQPPWVRAASPGQWNGVSSLPGRRRMGASLLLSTEVRPGSGWNYAGKQFARWYANWFRFLYSGLIDLFNVYRDYPYRLLDHESPHGNEQKIKPIAQHVSRLNEISIRDEDKESNALIPLRPGSRPLKAGFPLILSQNTKLQT